jgi:hypothetical protein
VLTDPSAHADIDGIGWVRGSLDGNRITAAGQMFRMAMFHENHPDLEMSGRPRTTVTLTYDWSAVPPLSEHRMLTGK